MIFEYSDYRSYLRAVLAERVSRNSNYSLRAMAKSIGLYSSFLHEVLQGAKKLSAQMVLKIASKLDLNSLETEYFVLLAQLELAKTSELRESISKQIASLRQGPMCQGPEIHRIDTDMFRAISDWYHFPILEMTHIQSFDFTQAAISEKLGVSPVEAQDAIDRLERLGLIQRGENGKYRKTHADLRVGSQDKDASLQKFHRQMLEKTIESLRTQNPQEKYVGSRTFVIEPRQLPEAYRYIEDFFQKMVEFFDRGAKPTHPYHLGVQLFDLSQRLTQRSDVK